MTLFDLTLKAVSRSPEIALSLEALAATAPCLGPLVPRLIESLGSISPQLWLNMIEFLHPHIPNHYRHFSGFSLSDSIELSPNISLLTMLDFSGLETFNDKTVISLRCVESCAVILKLSSTLISDYGLHQLSLSTRRGAWKDLAYLALSRTDITDKAVHWLAAFPALRILDVRSTDISTNGCVRIARSSAPAFRMARTADELALFDPKIPLSKLFDTLYADIYTDDRPFTITIDSVGSLTANTSMPPQSKNILNAHARGIGTIYSNTNISISSLHDQAPRDFYNDYTPKAENQMLSKRPVISVCPAEPCAWLLIRKETSSSPTHARSLNPPLARENTSTNGYMRKKTSRRRNALDDILGPCKEARR